MCQKDPSHPKVEFALNLCVLIAMFCMASQLAHERSCAPSPNPHFFGALQACFQQHRTSKQTCVKRKTLLEPRQTHHICCTTATTPPPPPTAMVSTPPPPHRPHPRAPL